MTIEAVKSTLDEVLPDWRMFSSNEVHAMQIAIRALAARAGTYKPGFKNRKFVRGTRVVVKPGAIFKPGSRGTVQSVESNGSAWVLLDGHTVAYDFSTEFLKFHEDVSPDHQCITLENGDCINPYCDLHAKATI